MRILHTADWHLGRIFHGLHLTEDQSYLMDQFVAMVKDVKPDVVIIAGDLYDRAVPPPDAVRLLDSVFSRLIEMDVTVAVIAGNHDSPARLGFGARLFEHRRLHVSSLIEHQRGPLVLHDEHGPVNIHLLPFVDPPQVRAHTGDMTVRTHAAAMEAMIRQARANQPRGQRSVLVAHATVIGARPGESERALGALAGGDAIDAAHMADFDYVALGHLHPRQTIAGHVHYPGSLMPYSFGEIEDERGISLVEMDARGAVHIKSLPLTPRRQVRKIRGYLHDLLQEDDGKNPNDFLCAVLYDEGALLDPIGRLREVYPNILQIERTAQDLPEPLENRVDHRKHSPLELFDHFFQEVTGLSLSVEEEAALCDLLEDMQAEAREVNT